MTMSREWRETRAREHARYAARFGAENQWEREFCNAMADLPPFRRLTDRQFQTLEGIVDRMFAGEGELLEEDTAES